MLYAFDPYIKVIESFKLLTFPTDNYRYVINKTISIIEYFSVFFLINRRSSFSLDRNKNQRYWILIFYIYNQYHQLKRRYEKSKFEIIILFNSVLFFKIIIFQNWKHVRELFVFIQILKTFSQNEEEIFVYIWKLIINKLLL